MLSSLRGRDRFASCVFRPHRRNLVPQAADLDALAKRQKRG
jgi:hypothetical protein